MRASERDGIGALLLPLAAVAAFLAPIAAHGQAARLFQQLSMADTIEERAEICDRFRPGADSPYAALFCEGYALLAAGRDSLAGEFLEAALRNRPDLAIGCVLFAEASMERGNLDRAEKWYVRARAIDPDRLDPHYGLGRIWLERAATMGEAAYEEALASMREMTRASPSSPDGWANMGMVQAMLGRYEEAGKSYERALQLAPGDPVLHHSVGSLAAMRGDEESAEDSWRRALEIDPSHAPAIRELAALLGRQGRIEEAVETLRRGVEAAHIGPEAGRVRRDLGLLHLLAGEREEAAGLFEQARVLSPDSRTLAALGHARLLQGSVEAGAALLAEAARLDSAVAAPIARAWEAGPIGGAATRLVVERLLPDWDLPGGEFTLPEETSALGYDTPPVPVYRALARYPEAAGGIGGTIHVQVRIDENGRVVDAEVLGKGGNPALEYAALDAARNWRFQPAQLKGKPVASEATIPFRFAGR